MLRNVICAILLLTGLSARACAEPARLTLVSQGAYAAVGTTQLVVHSARLGRDFSIVVSAPSGPLVTGREKLPAIYALDAGYGVAGPIGQMLSWAAAMSPAYVVSIGYPEGQDFRDTDYLYRPITKDGKASGGGGAAFAAFLSQDLRPFLQARFPLDPTKAILFGHSYGGVFTANTLVQSPDAYSGYIIASAATYRDPTLIENLKSGVRGNGQRIFIAAGETEDAAMTGAADQLAAALSQPETAFVVEKRIFGGANHISYYSTLVDAAFRWMLTPPSVAAQKHVAISLSTEALDRFVGVYAVSDGRAVTIARQGEHLRSGLTGSPEGAIAPEAPRRFFAVDVPAGFDVTLTFEGAEGAPASAVVVRINGVELRAVRRSR